MEIPSDDVRLICRMNETTVKQYKFVLSYCSSFNLVGKSESIIHSTYQSDISSLGISILNPIYILVLYMYSLRHYLRV